MCSECSFLRYMDICCMHSTLSMPGCDIRDTQNFRPVEVTWQLASALVPVVISSIHSLALIYYWLELSNSLPIWDRSSFSLTERPYSNSLKVTLSLMSNFFYGKFFILTLVSKGTYIFNIR